MVIVLDCPGCKKRYEVDGALAGKKSRCKQCGEVFTIPVPRTVLAAPREASGPPSPARTSRGDSDWDSVSAQPPKTSRPSLDTPAPRPRSGSFTLVPPKIVVNCPGCGRRYEVDSALAGKRSRCKDCREVFSIPEFSATVTESSADSRHESREAPVAARADWESVLEGEPASLKASRAPSAEPDDELTLPPPPRAVYPKLRRTTSSWRNRSSDPDIGIPIAGFYVLFAIVVALGFWIWNSAAEPTPARAGQVFAIATMFLHGTAMLLGFTGSIWLLIIAFREKLEQGLLCLLVPCYQLYYVCSRWQETRGPFILQMLPGLNVIVAVVAGLSIAYARGYDPLAGALSTDAGSVPAPPMPPARIVVKGQRFKVERAERIFREYGTSIDNLTNQLIDAQRPGTKVGSVRDLAQSFNIAEMLQKQVSQVNLNWVEWAAVKHRVGEQLRASLTALKGEMLKIESQPDKKGAFGEAPRMIDKEIIFWTLKSDEQVAPELEDGPAMPVGPVTVPAEQPQPGSGGQPGVGAPPGVGRRQGLGPPSGFGRRPGLNPPPGFGTPRARSGGGPFGRGSRNPANSGGNSPTYTPPG